MSEFRQMGADPGLCDAQCADATPVLVCGRGSQYSTNSPRDLIQATLGSHRRPGNDGHASGNVLLKHNGESGAVEEHHFEHGAAGEAVFVPVSPSAGEAKGYVMAYAHDLGCGATDLLNLAAEDFAGEPVRAFNCPFASHRVTMTVESAIVRAVSARQKRLRITATDRLTWNTQNRDR